MKTKRYGILLSNILGELYTKSFDCKSDEFIDWLKLEIGMTEEEIAVLIIDDNFPKDAIEYFIKNNKLVSPIKFNYETIKSDN